MDKKSGKERQRQKHHHLHPQHLHSEHFPWDKVSLPGAGNYNTVEQPTTPQVLNSNIQVTKHEKSTSSDPDSEFRTEFSNINKKTNIITSADPETETNSEIVNVKNKLNASNISNGSEKTITATIDSNKEENSTQKTLQNTREGNQNSGNLVKNNHCSIELPYRSRCSLNVDNKDILTTQIIKEEKENANKKVLRENVVDFELNLIETYDDYKTKTKSVGINELPLIKHELIKETSKIETKNITDIVVEVDPADVKIKKPTETYFLSIQPQSILKADASSLAAKVCDETHETVENENNILEALNIQIFQSETHTPDNSEIQVEKVIEKEQRQGAKVEQEKSGSINKPSIIIDKSERELQTLLNEVNSSLSQKVDIESSEVTTILKYSRFHNDTQIVGNERTGENSFLTRDISDNELKIVNISSPNTPLEAEEQKLFIESLPQIDSTTDPNTLEADYNREFCQSLKKYLQENNTNKPPVPLQTYRWEDLRRAKEKGGYPWTHLYKRPLGPGAELEIVLLLRKSQDLCFTSESPKSLKKVRTDKQISVKETDLYIQELLKDEEQQQINHNEDIESNSLRSENISYVSDSVIAVGKPKKSSPLSKIHKILNHRKNDHSVEGAQSQPDTSTSTSRRQSEGKLKTLGLSPKHRISRCYPIMKKLKSMADRQKKRLNIKRIVLKKDEKIVLEEETKILNLKNSPKSKHSEIPHFIEKQDSDDLIQIVQLEESPRRKRKDDNEYFDCKKIITKNYETIKSSIAKPSNMIEIENGSNILEGEVQESTITATKKNSISMPPKKISRFQREHVYEEIEQGATIEAQLNYILEIASVEALRESLIKQDNVTMEDIEDINKSILLNRMGSSEEDQIANASKTTSNKLAPISSIDSISLDEDSSRPTLPLVVEENDIGSTDGLLTNKENVHILKFAQEQQHSERKPSMKKETSPALSDKKVTFLHVEGEGESQREDIELPDDIQRAVTAASNSKWKNINDHEYEPIDVPTTEKKILISPESSLMSTQFRINEMSNFCKENDILRDEMKETETFKKKQDSQFFNAETITNMNSQMELYVDHKLNASIVNSSALNEELLKSDNCKKGFLASAHDRTRKMQAGLKNQAGKIKIKLQAPSKSKPSSESLKAKEKRRFKGPEFSKIKMPEIKCPDMSRLKEFRRPEFTKFNKPDMSKFKMPQKFSTLKIKRSKSFKENETSADVEMSGVISESGITTDPQPHKKLFEFNFGTYPRAFRKNKKTMEPKLLFETGTDNLSTIPSTKTQPSMDSSNSPQGDRGPGPVRSRWADKFSDVSYNDSEGSRYRRYGSEQESFDHESSLERRMREDVEETGSETTHDLGILNGVTDNKQFAEFDEENRVIHEISNLRAGEFKRRAMIHQDSDLRSEDSKEAIGWTDKEIQKNELLLKAELEAETSYFKCPSDSVFAQEIQSTTSSGKKVVMEEIDDDEFFLRKRGISEDNIELREYISNAIREGYDMPINALQHVGQTNEIMEYGDYDVPPPKPRRSYKNYRTENVSQGFNMQRSNCSDNKSTSQNGSDYFQAPKRPIRKGRSSSKYSMESQDITTADENISHEQYFDDDEEYLRPPHPNNKYKEHVMGLNNLNLTTKELYAEEQVEMDDILQPEPPRRHKRQPRETSIDKDSFTYGFRGRSVSNSYLQPTEDVIVYRTEHEYHIPLATPERYNDSVSTASLGLELNFRSELNENSNDFQEKFIIDMMENDGYAIVRKEHLPKPTPPARRKKFTRAPGERWVTIPISRTKRNTPSPERPPPPHGYTSTTNAMITSMPPHRNSSLTLNAPQNYEDDYEEPELLEHERAESPRNLQTGEIINKMKYRPLPAPPRPPREKRQRAESKCSTQDEHSEDPDDSNLIISNVDEDQLCSSSTADSYEQGNFESDTHFVEVEVSTQTDPLPDGFVCENFEITEDMKIIQPRRLAKTLEELLKEDQHMKSEQNSTQKIIDDEQLSLGLQRFREANQRSLSERSRASSQPDRSKSLSRPQTPSAVVIERRILTPVPNQQTEAMLEALLVMRPINDLDLEEDLRKEELLTDYSQQNKSEVNSSYHENRINESRLATSDYSQEPNSNELDISVRGLTSHIEGERQTERRDNKVEHTMYQYNYDNEKVEKYSHYYDENKYIDTSKTYEIALDEDEAETMPLTYAELETSMDVKEDIIEDTISYDYGNKTSDDRKHGFVKSKEKDNIIEDQPQPPPRQKSTIILEPLPMLGSAQQEISKYITPMAISEKQQPKISMQLPDLEVEDTRQHALQSGQITVSQLYESEISSEEFDSKSQNIVVQNIELQPRFIEDIVLGVRNTDREQHFEIETQISPQPSSEEKISIPLIRDLQPPPKPPRHRDIETTPVSTAAEHQEKPALERLRNLDEETQTDLAGTNASLVASPLSTFSISPPVYPTAEYLQSLAPLAFYNLRKRDTERNNYGDITTPSGEASNKNLHSHCHHKRRSDSSNSEGDDERVNYAESIELQNQRHHHSRSRRDPRETQPQTVVQAGRQFVSACSISLISIMNQLSKCISTKNMKNLNADGIDNTIKTRQVPTLVVLFIVVTFALLLFLLSGKNVHTHHWDFFNPPGNDGRQS